MKKIILSFSILMSASAYGQDSTLLGILPTKGGEVYYEEVVAVDSATKEMLYQRAKRWVVDAYKSAKDVIQLDDPQTGELVVKGKFETNWQASFLGATTVYVDHKINISVKDGKYKYQITDFVANGYQSSTRYTSGGPWQRSLESWVKDRPQNAKKYLQTGLKPEIDATIADLKSAMVKPTPAKEDW